MRRWLRPGWLLVAVITIGVALELFARFYLRLGDPPLYQTHPTIEYLFKPNQRVRPFGNLFITNRYSMRSEDFPPQKVRAREIRVMVYGDSVINGGSLTDHSKLATTLLQQRLTQALQRPVIVGNISAGSWGPPNELAYLKQFGFLGADVVILELSSEDFVDAPTFEPLNPLTHPTEAPWSAAWIGITKYVPMYLTSHVSVELNSPSPWNAAEPINLRDEKECLSAEAEFLRMAAESGVHAAVLQHWKSSELHRGQPDPGHDEIRQTALGEHAAVYEDVQSFRTSISAGRNPYRDDIHPNVEGQAAMADVMFDIVRAAVQEPGP